MVDVRHFDEARGSAINQRDGVGGTCLGAIAVAEAFAGVGEQRFAADHRQRALLRTGADARAATNTQSRFDERMRPTSCSGVRLAARNLLSHFNFEQLKRNSATITKHSVGFYHIAATGTGR